MTLARYLIAGILIIGTFSIASAAVTQYNFTDGAYTIHMFNGTGTLSWTTPGNLTGVEYQIIGGGGSGGGGWAASGGAGGGGAGGFVNGTGMVVNGTITITVGSGGTAPAAGSGLVGGNGTFSGIEMSGYFNYTAQPGGGGGGDNDPGNPGGSGGGGGVYSKSGGAGTTGQGNAGGSSCSSTSPYGSGGGGGKGGTGASCSGGGSSGAGGAGVSTSILGYQQYWAGGGGGSGSDGGRPGGSGVGGSGGTAGGTPGGNGTESTGSGGGGCYAAAARPGYGGSGSVVLRYIAPPTEPPIVKFSASTTSGVRPLSVTFTDLSLQAPTSWNWSFGDYNLSTSQNPTFIYNVPGVYSVNLTATNALGTNWTVKSNYITVYEIGTPFADFTAYPVKAGIGDLIAFTDASTNTPTSWCWTFDDGSYSGSQNPFHSYSANGLYDITLAVGNVFGNTSFTRTEYINITPYSGFNQQNTEMGGSYVVTIHFVNIETLSPIPEVNVIDSLGGSQLTSTGTFTGTYDYGAVVFYVTSTGYYGRTLSYIIDDNRNETIQLTPQTEPFRPMYPPHQVRFLVQTLDGHPIEGVLINATTIESTTPWSWLTDYLGFTNTTSVQTTVLSGYTGSDGSWVAMMVESIRYEVVATNATLGISESITIYPKEDNYVIYVIPAEGPSTLNLINGTLWDQSVNASYDRLGLSWNDTTGLTNRLTFTVRNANKVEIYNVTTVGAPIGNRTLYYDVPVVPGQTYYWGYYATNSLFEKPIRWDKYVTFEGRLIDLGFGSGHDDWYNWIAIAQLVALTGIFAATNRRYGAVFIPYWAAFINLIGWFPAMYSVAGWLFISIACTIGTLYYIRTAERQEHL